MRKRERISGARADSLPFQYSSDRFRLFLDSGRSSHESRCPYGRSTYVLFPWSFNILESADTNVFDAHKVLLCIRARLQSCRTGLKQCWALAPAFFSRPSSATEREKLLSNLVFRAGLATAGAKARFLLVCVRPGMSVTEGTGHVGNTFR
jgi:hypothetical protein